MCVFAGVYLIATLCPCAWGGGQVTESPEGMTLRDTMATQSTPPSFGGFTFVHESVFGTAYRCVRARVPVFRVCAGVCKFAAIVM